MFNSCTVGSYIGVSGSTINKDERNLIEALRKAGITIENVLALYEADGGAWRNEAMSRIAEWLEDHLKDEKNIKIIA
ncbi:hypothetical protein [Desulforamulus ruminis]|uniref:hypothetical protein n=1 Tax=Desulforamulus ruminis TaxID=1564 RepID=UPI002355D54A|nr:hypothetical protein [Desulforamulus ruminis]